MRKYDGVGRRDRIGLNFTEVGTGVRASVTLYDRGHSAAAGMKPGDDQLEEALQEDGVRWLHTGGIFSALSDATRQRRRRGRQGRPRGRHDRQLRPELPLQALEQPKTPSRPPSRSCRYIDCLIGNEEDFQKVLGYEAEGVDVENGRARHRRLSRRWSRRVVKDYPNIKVVGTTLRGVKTGLINNWSAIIWADGTVLRRPAASTTWKSKTASAAATASPAASPTASSPARPPRNASTSASPTARCCMSTRGDTSQITLEELIHVFKGGSARIKR